MSDRRIHRVRVVNPCLKPDYLPKVTAHALLRYAQRVHGFDLVKARLFLSGDEVQRAILHGADAVVLGDIKICLNGSAVTTVLDKTMRPKPRNKVLRAFADLGSVE